MPAVRVLRNPAWLFVSFAFALCASAGEEDSITVTISDSNRMSVPVKVNGQDTVSVIDTAATFALVDEDLLPPDEISLESSEITVQGLSDTVTYQTTEVDLVQVGLESFRAMPAGIVVDEDFPSHKAIIPASAFPQRVIDFDFQSGEIAFYDGRPISSGRHLGSRISYEIINGLIFIPIEVNRRHGRALIDTGAETSFINGRFAELANVRERPDLTQVLIGVDMEEAPVRVVSIRRAQLGRYRFSDYRLLALDPALFEVLGMEDEPVMVLGMDVLRNFRLQIDREREEIWISRQN